jgi:hypothetical protein
MIDLACHGDSFSESGFKDQVNPKRHTGFMNPQIPSCNWTCCHGGSSYPAMFKRYAHAASFEGVTVPHFFYDDKSSMMRRAMAILRVACGQDQQKQVARQDDALSEVRTVRWHRQSSQSMYAETSSADAGLN